jgi:hypothetical protein
MWNDKVNAEFSGYRGGLRAGSIETPDREVLATSRRRHRGARRAYESNISLRALTKERAS